MADYLLEIGTEEIPAKFIPQALSQLKYLAEKKLKEQSLSFQTIKTWGTPRRLVLYIENLAEQSEDLKKEVRGPAKKVAFDKANQPTKAALGFAGAQGVEVEDLVVKETENGAYLFAVKIEKGKSAPEILIEIAPQFIKELNFPKTMYWGENELAFARPIRWLVSLLDEQIIPLQIGNLYAGRITRGHRFLGEENLVIKTPQVYQELLMENYVWVEQVSREKECWRQITQVAAKGKVDPDPQLLSEITYLVEWPLAFRGNFAEEYLKLPEEVIVTVMREHQRYFPVRDIDGNLLNYFIAVHNGNSDALNIIRAGNERVLKARLADARFFWDEDLKNNLTNYLPELEKVIFQEKLGSLAEKTQRVEKLTIQIAQKLAWEKEIAAKAQRAAALSKADLVTNLVNEFPELQGIMGYYYALNSGEEEIVATAIREHYQPRFSGDQLPLSSLGALVSIADKLDTMAGCFLAGIEPSGSQDPYALRRQALGVCQILLVRQWKISLENLCELALANYGKTVDKKIELGLKQFLRTRLKNLLSEEGYQFDLLEAVLADSDCIPVIILAKLKALNNVREKEVFKNLLMSFTRAHNLIKNRKGGLINSAYFENEAEEKLKSILDEVENKIVPLLAKGDFLGIIKELAGVTQFIDDFFTAVLVMAEDEKVRENRLNLLSRYVALTRPLGDLSKIVHKKNE